MPIFINKMNFMKIQLLLISIMLLFSLASPCQVNEIYYSIQGTNITKAPNNNDIVIHLPRNSKVQILDQFTDDKHGDQKYYKINFNGSIGWVIEDALISNTERINRGLLTEKEKKDKDIADSLASVERKAKNAIEYEARIRMLAKKYGISISDKILQGKIWIGMTKEMAIDSWGKPDHINKDTNAYGIKEQWIYENQNTYMYFENNICTAFQEHK